MGLGLILFITYINDMPLKCQFSRILQFADDANCAKVYVAIPHLTDSTLLQHDLHNWSLENHLNFLNYMFPLVLI